MIEIGRLCIKTAGRDAGKKCVVLEIIDNTYVLVDGQTRRKKVNVKHLEPTPRVLEIQQGSSHDVVVEAFSKAGMKLLDSKPKKRVERPKQVRGKKEPEKEIKKVVKKKLDEKIKQSPRAKEESPVSSKNQEEPY